MTLESLFLPWLVIRELEVSGEHMRLVNERERAEARRRFDEAQRLKALIAMFDHDGDGKPGGSREA